MNNKHHFYLTFNPYLNQEYEAEYTQAHEFYDYLREAIKDERTSSLFWGKIIGKDRESNLDLEKLQNVLKTNEQENASTHLYITDFHHLWAGKVKSITNKLPKDAMTLPFYDKKNVEVWFEITDFILLEHNHEETANKLSEFYIDNKFNELKIPGMSPFTTSIKYPCIIQDMAEEQYFDEYDDSEISHLALKDNPAITKSNSNQVLKAIHAYVLPEEIYSKIPHAAKLEIEAAEIDMLEQRHHNMQKVALSYLRALEIIANDLIIHHIKRKGQAESFYVDATSAPPKLFSQPTKDHFITLKEFNKNFSLNHLLNFVDRASSGANLAFKKSFGDQKEFIRYFVKDFTSTVKENKLIEIRNALAHGENDRVSFKDAAAIRSIILGCGTAGLIPNLYRHFLGEKTKHLFETTEFSLNKQENKSVKKKGLKLVG